MSGADRTSATSRGTIPNAYELAEQIAEIQADLKSLKASLGRVAQEKAIETANQVEQTIRQNPLSAVAIAVGLGFLFGVFSRR
jgi:ElaB/YqjD/DUF883 family membrane-anchored ribosome-binding protein